MFGKEMFGDITFTLRKVKNVKRCKHPLWFTDSNLCIAESMFYAKSKVILGFGFDIKKIVDWAGDDVFTITAKKNK
jgi:hypothetical protein